MTRSAIFRAMALCGFLANMAAAENLYVTPSGAGTHNGSSWSNAFINFSGVVWGSGANQLGAGDTLWLAGGTYSSFNITGSGTASQRIYIKRATAANPACAGAAGWSAGFDAQVVTDAISSGSSYVTVDGVVPYSGIQAYNTATNETYIVTLNGANYFSLFNVDIKGVSTLSTNYTGEGRCISAHAGTVSGLHVAYCQLHGEPTLVLIGSQHNMIFEYNKLYDNVVGNPAAWHPNVWVSIGNSVNVTWRYNEVWNWMVEGIMMYGTTVDQNWYIYGNVWHDPTPSSTARILEAQYAAQGPIYFYNNTMVNVWLGLNTGNGGSWAAGCVNQNNIFWGTPVGSSFTVSSYNLTGNGGISTPFVNYAGKDYHISSASAARNSGAALSAVSGQTFNVDMDGTVRGADGTWDIGAYEYSSTGISNDKRQATNDKWESGKIQGIYTLTGKRINAGNIAFGGIYFAERNGKWQKMVVVK